MYDKVYALDYNSSWLHKKLIWKVFAAGRTKILRTVQVKLILVFY